MMTTVLQGISNVISIISIIVVVYGTLVASLAFIKNEFYRCSQRFNIEQLRVLRVDLGSYILFSLELLIASDILKTILEPGLIELGVLGGIVLLRTILSFFLNKEIIEIEKERREQPENFSVTKIRSK